MKNSKILGVAVSVLALAVLSGCSKGQPSERILQARADAEARAKSQLPPREEWSEAQRIMVDGMGLIGQKDVPAGVVSKALQGSYGGNAGLADLGIGLAGASSPPSGMSGPTAFGVSAGLFLLGGGSDPIGATQIAVWVPSELADSPEQASAVAFKVVEEARTKTYTGRLSTVPMKTGSYPDGHGFAYATLGDSLADRPIPFTKGASQKPLFMGEGQAYGPIFIRNDQIVLDASLSNLDLWESMITLSGNLPDWCYIYYPGQKLRAGDVPPAVFSKGKPLLFIGE